MISTTQARDVIGSTLYSADGDKIGKVGQLYLDDQTDQPEFVTVNTGLFGTRESYVPVRDATFDGDRLTVPFTKDQVKDAPNVDVDGGHLDESEEDRLYRHYQLGGGTGTIVGGAGDDDAADRYHEAGSGGLTGGSGTESGTGTGVGTGVGTGTTRGAGHDTSGPNTDDAMTRSEERVDVGKTRQETGRARLRKYVTTETETHEVPVRKEKAVLETEPVTEANAGAAHDGPAISEEDHEVTLSEEKVNVEKHAEPVERVRLGTETVTDTETVTEDVRKEHIDVEGDVDQRR